MSASARSGGSDGDGGNINYGQIYELLESLCASVTAPSPLHPNILRRATQHLANCPTSIGAPVEFNETVVLRRLLQKVQASPAHPNGTNGEASCVDNSSAEERRSLFLSQYEQMKASKISMEKRCALLVFLMQMSDTNDRKQDLQENGHSYNSPITPLSTLDTFGANNESCATTTSDRYGLASFLRPHTSGSDACAETHFLRGHGGLGSVAATSESSSSSNLRSRLRYAPASAPASNLLNRITQAFHTMPPTHATTSVIPSNVLAKADMNDIVQNVIYAFTGVEGRYLKKDLVTGRFKLDPREKSLTTLESGMILRLSEIGFYHDLVKTYSDEKKEGACALGLMGQGLMAAFREELTQYYGMVAILQEQFQQQRETYSQSSSSCSQISQPQHFTLLQLLIWHSEPLERLQWLAKVGEACKEKKGGALASIIYDFMHDGTPMVKDLSKKLLLAVCKPFLHILSRWLLEGEICDPHEEFFVKCLPVVGPERLWHDKYRIRQEMLPCFIHEEMAHKILLTGKSINFLSEICKDKQPVKGREDLLHCLKENGEQIFSLVPDTKLHTIIDSIYLNTSKRVLDIAKGPHKLLQHLQAMRRFLLLGQGDFIGILMENLKNELDKPAKELYSNDLSSIMDLAIRSSNAQYDDPEILNHLDVRLMIPCEGDTGWDILSLQYTVQGPLSTMLEPSMGIYQILFKPLWRLKRMEFVLSSKIWKDQMTYAKQILHLSDYLRPILNVLHSYTSKMVHVIFQIQYYIMFEVIECTWAQLQAEVMEAKTLDDILKAHDDFLNEIKCRAFLDSNSTHLSQSLEKLYDSITVLENWQEKFYEICSKEKRAREEYRRKIAASEASGKFGVTIEEQLEREHEQKIFEQIIISYKGTLDNIGSNYDSALHCFLLALNSSNDCNMQLFGMRLDFNEYYKKRDQRLSVPLTFEHMRMSNVFFNPSKSMLGSRLSAVTING